MYYEGIDEREEEHAKMDEDTDFQISSFSYNFSITNNGFKLSDYEVAMDAPLSGFLSNRTTYLEGNYELKNGKFVCTNLIPYEGALNGYFGNTSIRKLLDDEVKNASENQLKIMRNEIFARHGYIFKTDKMKDYFGDCSWYKETKTDVTNKLTDIENANIKLIKKYE